MTDLDIPAFLRIPATGRKAATPCKNESKSWALPAAATIGKSKISPAPRLAPASKHHFLHGLASSVEANRRKRKRDPKKSDFWGFFSF